MIAAIVIALLMTAQLGEPIEGTSKAGVARLAESGALDRYPALKTSDFFTFFHLTELRRRSTPNGRVLVDVKPGGDFRDKIDLEFALDATDAIVEATLLVDRTWLGDRRKANPFANDIVKSFLHALTGPEDLGQMRYFVDAISNHRGTKDHVIEIRPNPGHGTPPPDVQDALVVYCGEAKSFTTTMKVTSLNLENLPEQPSRLRLRIGRWISKQVRSPGQVAKRTPALSYNPMEQGADLAGALRVPEALTGKPYVAAVNRQMVSASDLRALGNRALPLDVNELLMLVAVVTNDQEPDKTMVQLSVYDGATAHAINASETDDALDSFVYWDPWGKGSYLQAGNNSAGVAATPHPTRQRHWRVSRQELAQVLYAVILPLEDLRRVSRLAERLRTAEKAVLGEYRRKAAGDFEVSERRLSRIGRALLRQGQSQPALALLRTNVALHPGSAMAAYCLAEAYERAENAPAAARTWALTARLVASDWTLTQSKRAELRSIADQRTHGAGGKSKPSPSTD